MTRSWCMLSLAIFSLGFWGNACTNKREAELQGLWVGESVQNFAKENLAMGTGWALGTSFDFRADNQIAIQIPAEDAREGRYRITDVTDGALTLEISRANGSTDKATLRVEGNQLVWLLGGQRELIMKRAPLSSPNAGAATAN